MLERFSRDISAKRRTEGMIVKEFLVQRLAPLQAHTRPVWEYRAGDDKLRLRSRDLPTEDLSRAVAILLGDDPGDLPEALGPLYNPDDWANLVITMPVFNEQGLLPAECSSPVEVLSGDTSGEGDSKKTVEDRAASVPLSSQSVLQRDLEGDDAIGGTSTGTPSRWARASRGLCRLHAPHGLHACLLPGSSGLSRPDAPCLCQWEFQGAELASLGGEPRDVVSPRAKRKKTIVKLKAIPDALPALIGASPSAGGEEEARGSPSLAMVAKPPELPKHSEATMGMPLPRGAGLRGSSGS
ncbi:hypothetical protein D1007_27564 [Hordeum vulgare]|nr:hypothetical protein D1007_27564 [Hordeum vulgare]